MTHTHHAAHAAGEGMETGREMVQRASGLHGKIATDVWPSGATLRCPKCGRTQDASSAQCARYLARGWPACCGLTMELTPAPPASAPEVEHG